MSSNAIDSPESTANTSQQVNSSRSDALRVAELTADLSADSQKQQFKAIHALAASGEAGELALAEFVQSRTEQEIGELTAAHGSAYQILHQGSSKAAKNLIAAFPAGLLCPQSDRGVDYRDLQMLLIQQKYQMADKLTTQKLCELAGEQAVGRKWVYFTEVNQFPATDLRAIDRLWRLYSEDKFGWSQQRQLWLRLGQDWERLWGQLQWKTDGAWTRYPNEFIWDLSAPVGHLPLSNQLRGVRTMDSLLCHPAWSD